jgi:hypothetical protein
MSTTGAEQEGTPQFLKPHRYDDDSKAEVGLKVKLGSFCLFTGWRISVIIMVI